MILDERKRSQLHDALQEAVVKCSERCLYQSAKWAAELLTSMPTDIEPTEPEDSQMSEAPGVGAPPIAITGNVDPQEALLEAKEINQYLLAKSFFDCKEFDRCAAVFLPETMLSGVLSSTTPSNSHEPKGKKTRAKAAVSKDAALPRLSQKSLFLALYAKYMSGEKRKDEESEMVMGPHDGGNTINKQLVPIIRILEEWFKEKTSDTGEVEGSQGWLEFLYGMILAKDKNEDEALRYLIRSVQLYAMNWSCWLEITALMNRIEDLQKITHMLPQNITTYLFHIHTSLELYQSNSALSESIGELLGVFPTSSFLMTCRALLTYHKKDLSLASSQFSELVSAHPYRLDSLDHYSNILYVMTSRPQLSFLAHLTTSIDRFRPETCVITGNYYSLLSQHEKAVQYFRRALTLDRNCLSAWTLMGHEYVEMKNTHAAIESYRRAVDVNRRDYRAWYGLGQTYEMLEMHSYALWYYKRAAGLRSWESKMWLAVGSCLQKMGRDIEGIKALKRALLADSYSTDNGENGWGAAKGKRAGVMDPEILVQIAGMYERLEMESDVREFMELAVAQEEGEEEGHGSGITPATSKARMWLAKWSMRNESYERALVLATELCQDGVEVEEAKALIREIRARAEG